MEEAPPPAREEEEPPPQPRGSREATPAQDRRSRSRGQDAAGDEFTTDFLDRID